ncbi:MAG TPA: sulfatase-like hydrolase/transferase [Thermoanaerobaculia bacterium]|nr:sulfatase-like hydrolase/transferase [Thermoanaerobaculia bacterium]
MRRTWGPILLAALLAAALTYCHGGNASGPFPGAPIVLISIDTLRSDHLPAYGYKGVETPAIDALRRDAILFARAYSHCPLTLPSHASLLSGLLPTHTGVRDNAGYTFDAARHPYLPRLLQQAGYETGAAVSAFLLRRATGLASGFDVYDDDMTAGSPGAAVASGETAERPGALSARRLLGWLKGRGAKPFFLFLHLYEPHTPYEPPEPFASRYRAAPYDGEIATADAVVGTVVAALKRRGWYDKAIIVLLSDHGEGLGDHGEEQHGVFLYRETLQVPLLLKLPGGARAGTTVATPAALVDVAPTLFALAGAKPDVPPSFDGQNLLTLPAAPARRLYAETFFPRLHYGWSELASLIEGRLHYIHGPAPELFDLVADPAEQRDVLTGERPAAAALRQALDGYDRTLAPPSPVDAETSRKLAALGYAGAARPTQGGALPDPRTKLGVMRDLHAAKSFAAEEKYGEAAALLRKVVGEEPGMVDAWAFLGSCLDHPPEDPPAALAAYQKAFELSGGAAELALPVARELHKMGRLDEAKAHAEMAAAADPAAASEVLASIALARGDADTALAMMRRAGRAKETFRRDLGLLLAQSGRTQEALEVLQPLSSQSAAPATLTVMAHALADAGRPDEATALLERALAADAQNAEAHELLGTIDLGLRKPEEARAHLRQAVALNPRLPAAWNSLGVALYAVEGPDAALKAWQQAVALDKTQYDALLNIGLVAAKTGRMDQARQALHRFVATAPPERFGPGIEKARQLLQEIGG